MWTFILPDLHDQFKFTPAVEIRSRFERRINGDFSDAASDDRSEWANRLRAGFDFTNGKELSGKVRWQYSHSLKWSPSANNSDEHSDLAWAFIERKEPSQAVWTAGRQPLKKGAGRLVDELPFSQRQRSFDGVRYRNAKADVFVGRTGLASSEKDYSMFGFGAVKWSAGETMLLFKRDDGPSDVALWTLDHRYEWKHGKWSGALEVAGQRGESNGVDLNAYWGHARVDYKVNATTGLYVEANVASGGGDSTEYRGFDSLYAGNHVPYGLLDVQAPRNMRHLELGAVYTPDPKWKVVASVNRYALFDPADAWYGNSGANKRPGGIFKDPSGAAGRDVGTEWGVSITHQLNKRDTLTLEAGIFKPGDFIRAFNGAATTDQHWLLLTYQTKF